MESNSLPLDFGDHLALLGMDLPFKSAVDSLNNARNRMTPIITDIALETGWVERDDD